MRSGGRAVEHEWGVIERGWGMRELAAWDLLSSDFLRFLGHHEFPVGECRPFAHGCTGGFDDIF